VRTKLDIYLNQYQLIDTSAYAWTISLHQVFSASTLAWLNLHGRWFSPGTPASSTTKTGHHDIDEILLKVELNTINQIKSI
jgi:hypothetical protein